MCLLGIPMSVQYLLLQTYTVSACVDISCTSIAFTVVV